MASWISNLWTKFKGAKPVDRLLIRDLRIPNADFLDQEIVGDECYLELFVESARLEKARSFATKFRSAVYTSVSLARVGNPSVTLTSVSTPEALASLDAKHLDKVIMVSRKMIGPVAWRGGTLHLELGLLSVKNGNVLTPVLDLVTQISSVAGLSFVEAAVPFIPLMTSGLELLSGQKDDTAIEIALDTDLTPKTTAVFAIVDAPADKVDVGRIQIDENGRLLQNKEPLPYGYCVFSLRQVRQKADFGVIPELNKTWEALRSEVQSRNKERAADALAAFRVAVSTSPDIISSDARRLVTLAQERFDTAFAELDSEPLSKSGAGPSIPSGAPVFAGKPGGGAAARLDIGPLSEIGLYD